MIRNQAAAKQPGKWTKTGKGIEDQGFDSYLIKVDGRNRVTKRNQKFLRKVVAFITATDNPPELRLRVPSNPKSPSTVPGVTPPQPTVIIPEPSVTQPQPSSPTRSPPQPQKAVKTIPPPSTQKAKTPK